MNIMSPYILLHTQAMVNFPESNRKVIKKFFETKINEGIDKS